MVYIDPVICNGISACAGNGMCVNSCPLNAISVPDGFPLISENCVDCGLCVMNCPREAIKL